MVYIIHRFIIMSEKYFVNQVLCRGVTTSGTLDFDRCNQMNIKSLFLE